MKRGLALGGGGSLGSYQIGVWQAMRELGITFDVVTGTSIGALNGAFFVTQKYDLARDLWENIDVDKVIKDGINLDPEDLKEAFKKNRSLFNKFALSYLKHGGADISPFIKLLEQYISAEDIHASPIRFGVVACSLPTFGLKRMIMQEVPQEDILHWLLASSAVWPVFPLHTVRNRYYIDGGYRDNVPIDFAFRLGADEVIAVDLWYNLNLHPTLTNKPNVTYISPSWDLGMMFVFKQKIIEENMRLGYNDAMKAFHMKRGFRYTFFVSDETPEPAELFVALLKCDYPKIWKKILAVLEKHTGGIVTPQNMYLRAVEILAETLGIDHLPIYNLNKLAEYCFDGLNEPVSQQDVIHLVRKVHHQQAFTKTEERLALCALKDAIIHREHLDIISQFPNPNPKMAVLFTLLALTHERLGEDHYCGETICLVKRKKYTGK
jgi:predicted acylesterase/phospholipase RssA